MSPGERERCDLAGLADVLFSTPARRLAPAAEAESRPAPLELVTATACGELAIGPLLALALSALPSSRPRCVVFGVEDTAPEWVRSVRHPSFLAELEGTGGRAFVVVPPRDTPEVRALGMAGARHLVWAGPGATAQTELVSFLAALHLGRAGALLGWLHDPSVPPESLAAHVEGWSRTSPGRTALPLGAWCPGRALPQALCAFLDADGPPPAGSLDWAWSFLRADPLHR